MLQTGFLLLCLSCCPLIDLLAFPTRRSSDLLTRSVRRTGGFVLTGKPETIDSSVGLVPINALVLTRLAKDQAPARCLELRSEEHRSELQSRENLVCRLLLEKKTTRRRQSTDW